VRAPASGRLIALLGLRIRCSSFYQLILVAGNASPVRSAVSRVTSQRRLLMKAILALNGCSLTLLHKAVALNNVNEPLIQGSFLLHSVLIEK
jgi:hypothetical protein